VKEERSNILSIESAVAGGSVALFSVERGTILRHDGNDCSRAEKIISVVRSLLEEAGLTLPDLNMIAASTGPGSYSGIRIGLSTALGLTSALNIPIVGVSVLGNDGALAATAAGGDRGDRSRRSDQRAEQATSAAHRRTPARRNSTPAPPSIR